MKKIAQKTNQRTRGLQAQDLVSVHGGSDPGGVVAGNNAIVGRVRRGIPGPERTFEVGITMRQHMQHLAFCEAGRTDATIHNAWRSGWRPAASLLLRGEAYLTWPV